MDLDLPPDAVAFREEVRAFLAEALTDRLREGAAASPSVFSDPDITREWQAILHRKGWLAYHWPVAYGGAGWTPEQRYVFEKECALAGVPFLPVLGLKLLGPVLCAFGTPEQKSHYLPRILSGEDYWCQGFSEPGAGSDLASLKTTAERRGDRYIINGSKIWTTHAHFADHMFCLARTDRDAKPQRGISFILIDMRQPGVNVRPIIGLAGDHDVNQVFFDNVEAPVTDLVGEEGQGWTIAKFLLENERGGSCMAPGLLAALGRLRAEAARAPDGHAPNAASQTGNSPTGGLLARDRPFAAALARAELEAQALETTELRILSDIAQGRSPGPQTSLVKMLASSLRQDVGSLSLRVHGYAGLQLETRRPLYGNAAPEPLESRAAQLAAPAYLNDRAWTIFGGSNEVQKTIIAKNALGL
jgi:alkylation response protein AidB-like acyl-CoA dehydrogenase